MDKIFTPNRYFVGFCALIVVFVFALNIVRDQTILEEAKVIGQSEAEWDWPSLGVSATVGELKAKILKHTENDAEVEVTGVQKIIRKPAVDAKSQPLAGSEEESQFKEVLTLYKDGKQKVWFLGKVEGK